MEELAFFWGNTAAEYFFLPVMFGIKTIITKHFVMLLWDMNNKTLDKIKSRNAFSNKAIVLMSGIVKGHRFPIIRVDTGSGNNRSSKITADIFNGNIGGAKIRFSPNIKAILLIVVDSILYFSERRTEDICHTIKKDLLEGITKEAIIKMFNMAPRREVTGTAFRDKGMDMRIPFKVTTKGVKNAD